MQARPFPSAKAALAFVLLSVRAWPQHLAPRIRELVPAPPLGKAKGLNAI